MTRTVMVTTLFTDLVDSTALASRLGADASDELRARYFGLLRGALAAGDGVEVKSTGDGVHVIFPTVRSHRSTRREPSGGPMSGCESGASRLRDQLGDRVRL